MPSYIGLMKVIMSLSTDIASETYDEDDIEKELENLLYKNDTEDVADLLENLTVGSDKKADGAADEKLVERNTSPDLL